MFNLVIRMPASLYRDSVAAEMKRRGDYRVSVPEAGDPAQTARLCAAQRADLLLLQAGLPRQQDAAGLEQTVRLVRERCPACRIVVLLDENLSEDLTERVKRLRQIRLIDSFVYTSCTMDYLADTLQTII